jgi:hypothetical protein
VQCPAGIDRAGKPTENDGMIFALFALIVLAFLVIGSIAFAACVLLAPTRRYALSTALWFAVWGPFSVAWMTVAGLGLVAGGLAMGNGDLQWADAPKVVAALGWGYVVVGALLSALVATCAAWLHQVLIHRLTLALFRLYAAAVAGGIGCVLGGSLGLWSSAIGIIHLNWWWWILETLILTAGFGTVAYKNARQLRGEAPARFTWISPEEFSGFD